MELFTKTKSDHRELLRAKVWGCPVFVLEPRLQDGHKIPKFDRRARMGQFLGFSDEHSSTVAQVRHLSSGYVSPQFHVVFDELFALINNNTRLEDTKIESVFEKLFTDCRDHFGEEHEAAPGDDTSTVHSPELGNQWLTEPERRDRKERLDKARQQEQASQRERDDEFQRLLDNWKAQDLLSESQKKSWCM